MGAKVQPTVSLLSALAQGAQVAVQRRYAAVAESQAEDLQAERAARLKLDQDKFAHEKRVDKGLDPLSSAMLKVQRAQLALDQDQFKDDMAREDEVRRRKEAESLNKIALTTLQIEDKKRSKFNDEWKMIDNLVKPLLDPMKFDTTPEDIDKVLEVLQGFLGQYVGTTFDAKEPDSWAPIYLQGYYDRLLKRRNELTPISEDRKPDTELPPLPQGALPPSQRRRPGITDPTVNALSDAEFKLWQERQERLYKESKKEKKTEEEFDAEAFLKSFTE